MIKKILVGLDSTPFTDTAIQYAIGLAKAHSAEVTGVAVVNIKKLESVGPVPIGGAYYAKNLRKFRVAEAESQAAKAIEKFSLTCKNEGVVFYAKNESGEPLNVMNSNMRYHDLTILGMRHNFDYSVIEEKKDFLCKLVKKSRQPIVACPEKFRSIKSALIVYDGSAESASAMKMFLRLNIWPGVETRVVCFNKCSLKAKELLKDAADYCKLYGINPSLEHVEENARAELLSYIEKWDADIVVMSKTYTAINPIAALFLSDMTLRVIRRSGRALFIM